MKGAFMARYKVDNLDDLFQVGCLGLVKAIDNFDMSYNVTLSTYACPMTLGWSKRCRILL